MTRTSFAPSIFVVLLSLTILSSGCLVQSAVNKRANDVSKLLGDQKESMYNCTPKELAKAEAMAEFARHESSRGRSVEAKKFITEAEQFAEKAFEISRDPRCLNDADGDGIADRNDKCPNQAEDIDQFEDTDGCPDPDNDGDGVLDKADACPQVPGPFHNKGCPVTDADGDGVPDKEDNCPQAKGPVSNRGCPFADSDGDGLLDPDDKCPMDKGPAENGGCPYKRIEITEKKIELKEKVFFNFAKTTIRPESSALLDEVAGALNDHPNLTVDIEGHTDDVGNDKANLKLSQGRAESVRNYMIKHGVQVDRMRAIGYGEERPIDDNSSEEGRGVNRRVEFVITSK